MNSGSNFCLSVLTLTRYPAKHASSPVFLKTKAFPTVAPLLAKRTSPSSSKKVIAGIVVITLLVAIGAVYAAINIGNTQGTVMNSVSNQTQQTEDTIATLLGNEPERINDPAWGQVATDIIRTENRDNVVLVIHSTTGWTGVVHDSDFVQQTIDGFGSRSIFFKCNTFGIFSNVVQNNH